MKIKIKRIVIGVLVGALCLYVGSYVGTTHVEPQGSGGLSGPCKVRVFWSEQHLVLLYPVYLVERWLRNRSFTLAVYHFNVDFEDGVYERSYLYDDGVYGRIWYDRN